MEDETCESSHSTFEGLDCSIEPMMPQRRRKEVKPRKAAEAGLGSECGGERRSLQFTLRGRGAPLLAPPTAPFCCGVDGAAGKPRRPDTGSHSPALRRHRYGSQNNVL